MMIREALQQAAAEMGEPLSQARYDEWRETAGDAPRLSKICRRSDSVYESWVAACADAGVEPAGKNQPADNYTTTEKLAAIQAAAEEMGEPLTSEEYDEWRRQQSDQRPTSAAIRYKTGSVSTWPEACALAGVTTVEKGDWSPTDCLLAIRLAGRETLGTLSQHDYTAWRSETSIMAPSMNVIKSYWPTYTKAREIAFRER